MPALRDIALIVLALQGALCALLPAAVLTAIHYGLYRSRWWQAVPRFLTRACVFLALFRERVEAAARVVSAPVFRISETAAAVRGVLSFRQSGTSDQSRGGGR